MSKIGNSFSNLISYFKPHINYTEVIDNVCNKCGLETMTQNKKGRSVCIHCSDQQAFEEIAKQFEES